MNKPHIVLVEHDIFLQDVYMRMLESHFQISVAQTAQACIDIMDSQKVSLVICDMQLGYNNGVEVLHELRSYEDWLNVPLIALSAIPQTSYPTSVRWKKYGIHRFIYKPQITPKLLLSAALSVGNMQSHDTVQLKA